MALDAVFTMTAPGRKRDSVPRVISYVYVLVAIVVLASAFAITVIRWNDAQLSRIEQRASGYHLATIGSADRIEREIFFVQRRDLELLILTQEANDDQRRDEHDLYDLTAVEFANSLYVIGAELESLRELQARYHGADYERTSARAFRQFQQIADDLGARPSLLQPESEKHRRLDRGLSALLISVTQLKKLHAITYGELVGSMVVQHQENTRRLVLLLLAPLGLAGFIVFHLLRLIRQSLDRQKRTEDALRESEASLANAQRIAHLGNYDWDIVTGEFRCSDEVYRIFAVTKESFKQSVEAFRGSAHPDDREMVQAAIADALEHDRAYDLQFRIVRTDGSERILRDNAEVIRDQKGRPIHWRGAVLDITERARAEQGVHELNEHLEQRVEECTVELRAAQDALLRRERLSALGQLTGMVAHEIRNPLGTIAISFSVIKHKCGEAGLDLGKTLDRVDRSIKRCDRIITELLDFARARGIQLESAALNAWLSNILREQHIPEGITVKFNLQTDGPTARFDPEELRRAVINVIDNACQAMADGNGEKQATAGGELTVASRLNAERVEIEFTDNGPGIPEDVLPQVLDPLFSTKSFGTGLGLPTVQRIMEEHGGGLEISSEEGRGTRVVLWLPPCGESEDK